MPMICPQCQGSFDQQLECPACRVPLQYQDASRRSGAHSWRHTTWGRILIGLVLAQGIYYALRQLLTAILLAAGVEDAEDSILRLVLFQGIQAFALVVAGLLAGAGKRSGFVFGGVMGFCNGILTLAAQSWGPQPPATFEVYGHLLLHAPIGAIGGAIGGFIWSPPPPPVLPGLTLTLTKKPPARKVSPLAGPILWSRVLVGLAVAVLGAFSASLICDWLATASRTQLLDTPQKLQLVTWEIAMLAICLGSAGAGANTPNGLKQGLVIGLGSGFLLHGLEVWRPRPTGPVLSFLFTQLGFDLGLRFGIEPSVQGLIFTMTTTLLMGPLCGWFGSQLLPPVAARKPRKSFGPTR